MCVVIHKVNKYKPSHKDRKNKIERYDSIGMFRRTNLNLFRHIYFTTYHNLTNTSIDESF